MSRSRYLTAEVSWHEEKSGPVLAAEDAAIRARQPHPGESLLGPSVMSCCASPVCECVCPRCHAPSTSGVMCDDCAPQPCWRILRETNTRAGVKSECMGLSLFAKTAAQAVEVARQMLPWAGRGLVAVRTES
jgi:hypothetical protein